MKILKRIRCLILWCRTKPMRGKRTLLDDMEQCEDCGAIWTHSWVGWFKS